MALGLAWAFMALVPSGAGAGVVNVHDLGEGRYFLSYHEFPGDDTANNLRVTRDGDVFTLTDTSETPTPGLNCEAASGGVSSARLRATGWWSRPSI